MPASASPAPRKMLPPPITRPTWTPSPRTSAISAATRRMIAGSMPYCWLPSNASPLSFKRIRRYAGELCAMSPSLPYFHRSPGGLAAGGSNGPRLASLGSLRHDLTDEVGGFFFYPFADLEAPKALHLRLVGGEHVAHALLVVLHEHLARER